ncbi:hypothetical protein Asppvi_000185 [Aspergillus pseudoviridinutans]|uniref:Cupin type-1 domain-containing protein n=1 Tax=Aspergillus pseudoviridinutans TaxID=1517512 RepID=A0A9P3EQJ6_9EURO|nr:uncharacterized protein Asppvi_000185 [Aspergillus pseudoviridinutans]GIJ81685.1 hypothetical protein Asppvi_000185 [Aspergillus pseudoviridinutans]
MKLWQIIPASSLFCIVAAVPAGTIPGITLQPQLPFTPGFSGSGGTHKLTLSQQLLLAPSRYAKYQLLANEDFMFDFGNSSKNSELSSGGYLVDATGETFPALIGQGVGMAVSIMGPCGFNTPHSHNGGTEFNLPFNGTIQTFMMLEPPATHSGATPRVVNLTLNALQATIFPQGSIHMEFNPSCETIAFVAAFGTDDFGRTQQFESLFSLPDIVLEDALGRTLDEYEIDMVRKKIPGPVILGVDECMRSCGMSRPPRRHT